MFHLKVNRTIITSFLRTLKFRIKISEKWRLKLNIVANGNHLIRPDKNVGHWDNLYIYMGYVWPSLLQGHLGVIQCTVNFYFCLKMTCILKIAALIVKWRWSESWDSRTHVLGTYRWGTSDLLMFKIILGLFGALFPKLASTSNMVGHKSETCWNVELGDSKITHIFSTFDLVVFKVILGSFSALVSKWSVTWKQLIVHVYQNRMWNLGLTNKYMVYVWLVVFKVFESFRPLISKLASNSNIVDHYESECQFGTHRAPHGSK